MSKESCVCKWCVECCKHAPGWFAPGEAEKAAAHLGMDFEAFKSQYLIREFWVGGAYVYAPRKTTQPEGFQTARWSDAFRPAPCIFLTPENRCMIHAAKPKECRDTICNCCGDQNTSGLREEIQALYMQAGDPLNEKKPE